MAGIGTIGGKSLLLEMRPLAHEYLAFAHTVSLAQICAAIRLLAERRGGRGKRRRCPGWRRAGQESGLRRLRRKSRFREARFAL